MQLLSDKTPGPFGLAAPQGVLDGGQSARFSGPSH
jgi:hypothetical protein